MSNCYSKVLKKNSFVFCSLIFGVFRFQCFLPFPFLVLQTKFWYFPIDKSSGFKTLVVCGLFSETLKHPCPCFEFCAKSQVKTKNKITLKLPLISFFSTQKSRPKKGHHFEIALDFFVFVPTLRFKSF